MSTSKYSDANLVIPRHVAIIMDGNGRWAEQRGLPRLAGHRAGTENLRKIIEECVNLNIKHLTIYAFSTENWQRPPDEVSGLMKLLETMLDRELKSLNENGVRIRHLGHCTGVNKRLVQKITEAVELTSGNSRMTLNVAFNYGGRDEMVRAVQRIISDGLDIEEITEGLKEISSQEGNPVVIDYSGGEASGEIELPKQMSVTINDENLGKLERLCGNNNIQLVYHSRPNLH